MMAARSKSGGQLEASKELGHSSANSPLTPRLSLCVCSSPHLPHVIPCHGCSAFSTASKRRQPWAPDVRPGTLNPQYPLHPSECVNTDMLYTLWLWSSLKHINARWTASLRWAWALAGEIRAWAASPWVGAV
jgi:hypothetical protein